ncbi:lysosomal-trafficking regulator [Battus philenor]|uniref:lysosomal-trafficking regulator n=1 Tax=Battus philenor TaxID=42288 RepID=UPI0035D0CF3F
MPVPPLQCESSGSSADGSSSEDAAGPYASDHSEPHARNDDGYEADVEIGKLEARGCKPRKLSDTVSVLSGLSECQSPVEAMGLEGAGGAEGKCGELAHPELCLIVVDVLTQLIHKVMEEQESNGTQEKLEVVCGGLARAVSARLAAGGAPPGLLRRVLAPPTARLLRCTQPHLAELQHSILELIHVVASQNIEPCELAALLQLFAAEAPPMGPLLGALQRLVAHAKPCTPDFVLNFPAPLIKSFDGSECTGGPPAARCSVEGANWGPWMQGFAVVLWLQPLPDDKSQEPDLEEEETAELAAGERAERARQEIGENEPSGTLTHVLSLGQDALMLELYLNVATGVPWVRLSRAEVGGARALCGGSAACRLPAARWSCLALNVREAVLRRRIHIQVTFYVNGRECDTVSLPLQGILVRKMSPTSVLLGQATGGAGVGAWQMGPLSVYRSPVLTAPLALHLAAHGPDHACQVRCEEPNFSAILTPEVLDINIDWDQVYELPVAALRELHEQLMLTYSPHAHDSINFYQQVPAPQTGFSGRGGGSGGGGGGAVTEALRVQWAARASVTRHRGLAPALLLLGGPELLLYLFARVVEAGGDAVQQAAALGVLLRAARSDARLHAALHARGVLDMLLPVLAAPACRVSHHMLKEVLDVACSAPLLSTGGAGGAAVRLAARPDCALLEPRLLLLLLRAWPDLHTVQVTWEVEGGEVTEDGSLWALALEAICALLRDGPRRAFNQQQAARADLLRHLLLACKERFLNSDSGPLSTSASNSLVELVRALMGTPPLLCHLALLCDFLLLMHQASDTFVTHSRANFYFLLTAETPEASEFNFLTFINKRKSKEYKLNRTFSTLAIDEVVEERRASLQAPPSNGNSPLAAEHAGADSGTDDGPHSTKEMKSIINAQIKEGRKENGKAGQLNGNAVGAAGTEAFNGYVLVDEDELRHTTVELYTGGIYQQRRVRAGAEPGWTACAGLLLLLRDSLAALPENLLAKQAVCGPVQAENLVVLANHRTACVRAAVVRCVCALQRRAPHALLATAAAGHYYMHLADQISLYPGSWELATACAALLTKCDVPLEDQLHDDIWLDIGEDAAQRGAPLLALLPACLHSVPLAHHVALLLRRLVHKVSLKAITEVALPEVVARCIRDVGLMDAEFEGRELLVEDLCELLNKVVVKALANNHSMQTVVDVHLLVRYVAAAARGRRAGAVRRLARAAEGALFAAQLDHLEARLDHCYAAHTKHTNYFANVLGGAEGGRARAELSARYSGTLSRALAFLLARSPRAPLRDDEPLFRRLLDTLLLGASGTGEQRAKWWAGWGAECAAQLQELFWWAAGPAEGARALQPALLRALYRAPRTALAHLAPKDPTTMRKLAVYLLIMLQHIHAAEGAGVELAITDWARGWAVATQAGLAERLPCDMLHAEAERFLADDEERWAKSNNGNRQRAAVGKAVFAREALAARCTESAMAVTRRVVEAQNAERKTFLEHLRRSHASAAAAAQRWARLLDAHTHERGVWHNPRGWPAAWQLDSTEGPGRVRVRLRRAHLRIPARCLQPHARHKAEAGWQAGPLRGVLGPLLGGARHGGLTARLQPTESVAFMARVHHVTVDSETNGELLLSDRYIHFVPECPGGEEEGSGGAESCAAQCWALSSVARVCPRRWCLQERAAELFLLSGHAHLLAFAAANERDAFLRALDAAHLPNRTEQESLSEVMNQWRNGTITNWEYLMALNGLAGRSYNDLMQYPVLPFIIADYTSKILDLNDPASFRDLSKPMAVHNKNREQHYINTYNDLKMARREGCSPLLSRQPHHYASLYSNSGGVLHYLVRMPPFTELFLNYQDNNFDMPDRTFHSLATTWRLITKDSPTDVKELIPELFYLPEMFYNNEGLELGVRQCGARVDDVELPRWAADARLFTLAHRQALEAPLVTERLPLWIDLVFGYKQTGQPAVDAINVFPACTYYGFDPSAHEDEVDRTAAEAMVRTYGQAPRQLLRAPHPHAAHDLAPHAPHAHHAQAEVMAGVSGVRWGRYCGSPAQGAPAVVARRQAAGAAHLVPLPAPHQRAAAACAAHTAPLPYGEGGGLALLWWGHADGALRLRTRRDAAAEPLLHVPALDQVTSVCTSCAVGAWSWAAFVGLSSGRVLALRAGGGTRCSVRQLLAHRAPIAALCVCARAALLASADTSGLLLLWDLNRLTYIRTLPNRDRLPITQVAISETLADVATVHELRTRRNAPHPIDRDADDDANASDEPNASDDTANDVYENDATHKYQSLIRVHTVNGRFVGSVKVPEVVTCICYSNAPEGASVNCIAAGLGSGEVRLYSSWDLRPARTLPAPAPPAPLLSLAYSSDSQVLFASYEGGLLLAWEAPHARAPPPRIVLASALL